jgi:hypothetical protein
MKLFAVYRNQEWLGSYLALDEAMARESAVWALSRAYGCNIDVASLIALCAE